MKKIVKKSLLLAAVSLASSIGTVQAGPLSCYHIIEATCRAEENNDHVGFIAITWAVPAGHDLGFDSCSYPIDVQYKFYDYLKNTIEAPTLCRSGDVAREDIHAVRQTRSFEEALGEFQKLRDRCIEPNNGFVSCVTVQELDLDQGIGSLNVMSK